MAKRTIFLQRRGILVVWMVDDGFMGDANLLRGSCALINRGMGRERINKSDVMLNTASSIMWL